MKKIIMSIFFSMLAICHLNCFAGFDVCIKNNSQRKIDAVFRAWGCFGSYRDEPEIARVCYQKKLGSLQRTPVQEQYEACYKWPSKTSGREVYVVVRNQWLDAAESVKNKDGDSKEVFFQFPNDGTFVITQEMIEQKKNELKNSYS